MISRCLYDKDYKKMLGKNRKRFIEEYKRDPDSSVTRALAHELASSSALGVSDANTPLVENECNRAMVTGEALSKAFLLPDLVYLSPYIRTRQTFDRLCDGWPGLKKIRTYEDERLREQEHGLALLYNDWRVFFALYPEQRKLYEQEDRYWYRWPQGESVPDVRERNRSWLGTCIREFAGKHMLVITHHLNILAVRANLERLDSADFLHLDEHEKPINCGVTRYEYDPDAGTNGKLMLKFYNRNYYKKKIT